MSTWAGVAYLWQGKARKPASLAYTASTAKVQLAAFHSVQLPVLHHGQHLDCGTAHGRSAGLSSQPRAPQAPVQARAAALSLEHRPACGLHSPGFAGRDRVDGGRLAGTGTGDVPQSAPVVRPSPPAGGQLGPQPLMTLWRHPMQGPGAGPGGYLPRPPAPQTAAPTHG